MDAKVHDPNDGPAKEEEKGFVNPFEDDDPGIDELDDDDLGLDEDDLDNLDDDEDDRPGHLSEGHLGEDDD